MIQSKWKAIGRSATGTSHTATGKTCEDAVRYHILTDDEGNEALVCAACDGAGSALHAQWAATYTADKVIELAIQQLVHKEDITECHIYAIAEDIYDGLRLEAQAREMPLNEYSCTLLGCIIMPHKAAFFQVGDGAIVRNDGSGHYVPVWWPHNGEYQNSTSFLVDDSSFANLNVTILEEEVNEIAMLTDGLQMLALRMEDQTAHQPFFNSFFPVLRCADVADKLGSLNEKLAAYLDSPAINDRTDDDKTLFLATRLLP